MMDLFARFEMDTSKATNLAWILIIIALALAVLMAIKRKGQVEEDNFGNPQKYVKLEDDYQCAECGQRMKAFSPPLKNQSRSFRRHLQSHKESNSGSMEPHQQEVALNFDDDQEDADHLGQGASLFDNQVYQQKVEAFRNLTGQEKFLMQCFLHRKEHPKNSISFFDGIFRRLDWTLNKDPISSISWRRVQYLVDKKLPISNLRSITVGNQSLLYLSPMEISRRFFFAKKSDQLTGWRGKDPNGTLSDIYDGTSWNEFIESGFLIEKRNVVYMLGADGFSKFRSKSSSVAGIYLVPLNLPAKARADRRNWSTICCFSNEKMSQSDLDSALHQLLDLIVDDFLILDKGITLHDARIQEDFFFRARIGLVVGDLQEMAEILEKTHPGGIHCCHVCDDPNSNWAKFLQGINKVLRTHETTADHANLVRKMKQLGKHPQAEIDRVCQRSGMNGETPLFRLPYWNYLKHVGIDVMHNVILGWSKEVTLEIFTPLLDSKAEENIAKIAKFDSVLRSTQYPPKAYQITRSIRHLKDFTSAEWLALMRYGYPGLLAMNLDALKKQILEDTWKMALGFLKPAYSPVEIEQMEGHFRLYANATWTRLGWDRLSCSLNWHIPVHLPRLAKQWGPWICQWCWVIERMNQACKAIIDSGNYRDVENYVMYEMTIKSDLFHFGSDFMTSVDDENQSPDDGDDDDDDGDDTPQFELSRTLQGTRPPFPFENAVEEVEILKFLKIGPMIARPSSAKKMGTFVKAQIQGNTVFGRIEQICKGDEQVWVWVKAYKRKATHQGPLGAFFEELESPIHTDLEGGPGLYFVKVSPECIAPVACTRMSSAASDRGIPAVRLLLNHLVESYPPLCSLTNKK